MFAFTLLLRDPSEPGSVFFIGFFDATEAEVIEEEAPPPTRPPPNMLISEFVSSIELASTSMAEERFSGWENCAGLGFTGGAVLLIEVSGAESSWNNRAFADLTDPRGGKISASCAGCLRLGEAQAIVAATSEGDFR